MPETKRICISCERPARSSVTVMVGTLVTEPRKMLSSTVAVCGECIKPGSPGYDKFHRDLGLLAWMKQNDLIKLLETIPTLAVDVKTAAAGGQ